MESITVVHEGREYEVEVDVEEPAAVLAFQLFSLLGVDVEEQLLLTSSGRRVDPDETFATFAASTPWLLLLRSLPPEAGTFNPFVDSDWQTSCTRLVASQVPLVQPAYTANGIPVCHSCATTCCSQGVLVQPVENNVEVRQRVQNQFICDLDVIVGAADVSPPVGYTKLNVDLNYSASGPFVFLCYKTGGPSRPIAHVKVVHTPDPETLPQLKGYTTLPVNCNIGTKSTTGVFICYSRVPATDFRNLSGLAIQALNVSSESIEGAVQSTLDLNAGNAGATPLFLSYTLNPLGGFVCGWLQLSSAQVTAAQHLDATQRRVWHEAAIKHFQIEEPRLKEMLTGQLQNTMKYERKDFQEKALATIPLTLLHERARSNPTPQPTFEDEVLRQLIRWFKHEFFSWMNSPACRVCGQATQSFRQEGPSTPEEVAGGAGRVEVYQCVQCRALTRFPRYNDPTKLLETRTGRCGEWANCFTLCCRALGYEARYVHDFTDHVWTEVYSPHHERWLHCDPCEDQMDCPLTYEVGWGKKLTYIFATSCEELVDVARRYTRDFDSLLDRRTLAREDWLQRTIREINMTKVHSPARQEVLRARAIREERELAAVKTVKAHETVGRISGSQEWRDSRDESGSQVAQERGPVSFVPAKLDAKEQIQKFLVGMLRGCTNASCVNPFCLHAHDTKPVLDASGLGHHGTNDRCPLQKSLQLRHEQFATGLQLLPGTSLKGSAPSSANWTLMWLIRWTSNPLQKDASHAPTSLLNLQTTEGSSWYLSYSSKLELQSSSGSPSSTAQLAPDTTYHLALASTSAGIVVFVNGIESFRSPTQLASSSFMDITFELNCQPSLIPIVSHVAWSTQALTTGLLQTLVRTSIPSPKLVNSGPSGAVDPSIECLQAEAAVDSDFDLTAVHLWEGDFFDGLQCEYKNRETKITVPGRSWTVSTSSTKRSLTLLDGEYFIQVRGRSGAWMDQLVLTTNFGRTLSAGGNGGDPFEIAVPKGHMVRAFHFALGDHVEHPVVFTCPAPKVLESAVTTHGKTIVAQAVSAVVRYLTNVANEPTNTKFHTIKCSNNFFEKNVAPLGEAVEPLFAACGFDRVVEGGNPLLVFRAGTSVHVIRGALWELGNHI
ncbi:unnamed protein product [Aphanomyces euteiches]